MKPTRRVTTMSPNPARPPRDNAAYRRHIRQLEAVARFRIEEAARVRAVCREHRAARLAA